MLDLQSVISSTRVRLCLDCGKCTVVCPVAWFDPEFNPRRIVQEVLRQNGQGTMDEKIWSCISCSMCVERCNYNVRFTDFIRSLRYKALEEGTEIQYSHGGAPQTIMHIMAQKDVRQKRLHWLPKDIELSKQCDTAFFVGCAPFFSQLIYFCLSILTIAGSWFGL